MRQIRSVHVLSLVVVGVVVVGLGACSQSQPDTVAATPSIEEKTFQSTPAQVTYLDEAGQPIRLAEGRSGATFEFPYYQDRLDPGRTTTARLDVPFPAAALKEARLGEVRVELTYIPIPIREETMSVKVALSASL